MLIMLVAFMLVFFAACSDTPADTVDGEEGANEVTEPEGDSAGEEASEAANGGELTPVTLVLDWTPNTNHSGAYVAQALGYFEEQGLDVEIIEPGDNLALQLLGQGRHFAHAHGHGRVRQGDAGAILHGLLGHLPGNGLFVEGTEDDAFLTLQKIVTHTYLLFNY